MNLVGAAAKNVLNRLQGAHVRGEIFLPVSEINHVLGKIGIFCAVTCRKLSLESRADITQRELTVLVVIEVIPVLLNVHLVGVKPRKLHPSVQVLVQKLLEVGRSRGAKVIHLEHTVLLHYQHAIEVYKLAAPTPTDLNATGDM